MKKFRTDPPEVHIRGRKARRRGFSRKPHTSAAPALVLVVTNHICWLTPTEILELVEYLDDTVTEIAVKVAIYNLLKAGKLEKRPYSLGGRKNGVQVKKPFVSCA